MRLNSARRGVLPLAVALLAFVAVDAAQAQVAYTANTIQSLYYKEFQKDGRYYVFNNADNAARLEEKLKAQGHNVSADNITLDGGAKAVRLRVGPFHDRPLALKAQARIQQEVGVQGVVLAYP